MRRSLSAAEARGVEDALVHQLPCFIERVVLLDTGIIVMYLILRDKQYGTASRQGSSNAGISRGNILPYGESRS